MQYYNSGATLWSADNLWCNDQPCYFSISDENIYYTYDTSLYGASVRCFKDSYVAPTPQYEITFEPNNGETATTQQVTE